MQKNVENEYDDNRRRPPSLTENETIETVTIELVVNRVRSKPSLTRQGEIQLWNPLLAEMEARSINDNLYHLGIHSSREQLRERFGDIRFIAVGGAIKRMRAFADKIATQVLRDRAEVQDLTTTDRYSIFKIGPILSITHGMGKPSMSILIEELIKLIYYAKCRNATCFRIGTSGGIGVAPGTVVVSDRVVNGRLECFHEYDACGQRWARDTTIDTGLLADFKTIAATMPFAAEIIFGTTMTCDDFYQEQMRRDGAFIDFDIDAQKRERLERCRQVGGVRNIEMEAGVIAAACRRVGIPCAIVCTVLVDRLKEDQILLGDSKRTYEERATDLCVEFIRQKLVEV